jgi:cell division protease FtsH
MHQAVASRAVSLSGGQLSRFSRRVRAEPTRAPHSAAAWHSRAGVAIPSHLDRATDSRGAAKHQERPCGIDFLGTGVMARLLPWDLQRIMHPVSRFKRFLLAGLAVTLTVGLIGAYVLTRTVAGPSTVAFSELLQQVRAGEVAGLRIEPRGLVVTLRDGRIVHTVPPAGFVAANPTFIAQLADSGVLVDVEPASRFFGERAISMAFMVGLLGVVGLGLAIVTGWRPRANRTGQAARADQRVMTFADVAGVDEARAEVQEVVQFLREPARFESAGGRIPRGVLLVGPPGTGKTLLARAIAGEAGVPFLFASASDFVEKYVGVGASRVRRLFRDARKHRSCIVFIDELDAVGRHRGAAAVSHEEREQTLNQLLVEMDGFDARTNIVVVAATNRADILDQALLRPGRFDRQVFVGLSDIKGREAILRVHTRRLTLAEDVVLWSVARGTPGFSGAELANVVNEAALLAARHGRLTVTGADFEMARDKVLMGVERRSLVMTPAERRTCAYHEAGHAVVAASLQHADPLHKVTIIPRGHALGVTMQLPETDRHTHSQGFLDAQVAILMGGRIAEEVFLNQKTSGASNDIERATDIARRMVCVFGMSPLGLQAFGGGTRSEDRQPPLSEHTARQVDEHITRVLTDGYDRARHIIEVRRSAVEAIAEQLLMVETLDASQIARVLSEHDAAQPLAPAVAITPLAAPAPAPSEDHRLRACS